MKIKLYDLISLERLLTFWIQTKRSMRRLIKCSSLKMIALSYSRNILRRIIIICKPMMILELVLTIKIWSRNKWIGNFNFKANWKRRKVMFCHKVYQASSSRIWGIRMERRRNRTSSSEKWSKGANANKKESAISTTISSVWSARTER